MNGLFSAETISGDFDVLTLVALGEGLGWQLDFLTNAIGTLDVPRLSGVASTVPVPAAVWLVGAGLIGLIGIGPRKMQSARPANDNHDSSLPLVSRASDLSIFLDINQDVEAAPVLVW